MEQFQTINNESSVCPETLIIASNFENANELKLTIYTTAISIAINERGRENSILDKLGFYYLKMAKTDIMRPTTKKGVKCQRIETFIFKGENKVFDMIEKIEQIRDEFHKHHQDVTRTKSLLDGYFIDKDKPND